MCENGYEFDVGLSFAGEQRDYVEQVADKLRSRGVRVFFDEYAKAELWGKDLYSHLDEIYQHRCRYCILFASREYAEKVWTSHERKSAQARALKEKQEYILPARFDETQIPGLRDTVHYIDLEQTSPSGLARLALQKLGNPVRQEFLPPVLDLLFGRLGIDQKDHQAQSAVNAQAWSFFEALREMSPDERTAVITLLRFGCDADMPDSVHINTDYLRRLTGKSVARLKQLLSGVRSLGFLCSIREHSDDGEPRVQGTILGEFHVFELSWSDRLTIETEYPALEVACEMVAGACKNLCDEHSTIFLDRLNFSQLSKATASVG